MLKRLHAYLFGKQRQEPAQALSYYPIVGSSAAESDTTMLWSGPDASTGGLDRTVFAPSPEAKPVTQVSAREAAERQRLAWPARDASRSQGADPSPREPEAIAQRADWAQRPAEDMTVLVARRPRPGRDAV